MTVPTVIRGERASARSRRPIRDGGRPQGLTAPAEREYALFVAMVAVNPVGWMADVASVPSGENRSHGSALGRSAPRHRPFRT
jgi:hypothetical protein